MTPDFLFRISIQIRFKDVDALGHVNNANHVSYFELARVHYFNEVINEKIDWSRQGIILAKMEVEYKIPILLNDEVLVYARTSRFGTSSFEMEYLISRKENGVESIAASGKSIQVCYDYENKKSIPVPQIWKDKVIAYEPYFSK